MSLIEKIHPIEYENLGRSNQPFLGRFQDKAEEILRSGWFILGQEVRAFETEFADYVGTPHCIGVASGLDALMLGLRALNLPPHSEVITASNTYIATILAILQAGHRPVLVEPDIGTYNLDPTKLEESITPQTRAIIVVHLYGKPCRMDLINKICHERQVALIEDCAQAHGAKFDGQNVGTFGIGAFSFYPTKNLGALGDAGAITCKDTVVFERIKALRNYGSKVKYFNEVVGFNSRLDELQAGFLRIKLEFLDSINEHKKALASIYDERLRGKVITPHRDARMSEVFHIYNIRHPRRDDLRDYLQNHGIRTEIHYPLSPHRQKALSGIWRPEDFPIADEIHRTTLSLPISTIHSADDIERVCEAIVKF